MADVTDHEAALIAEQSGVPVWMVKSEHMTDELAQAHLDDYYAGADKVETWAVRPPEAGGYVVEEPGFFSEIAQASERYTGSIEGVYFKAEEMVQNLGEGFSFIGGTKGLLVIAGLIAAAYVWRSFK